MRSEMSAPQPNMRDAMTLLRWIEIAEVLQARYLLVRLCLEKVVDDYSRTDEGFVQTDL